MTTTERLNQYWDFEESITAAIEETAARQNRQSFKELAEAHGLADKPQRVWPFQESLRSLEYWDLKPEGDYDENQARILFAPFGITADESMAMRAMRLFDARPDKRLLVVGNAGYAGGRAHPLGLRECWSVYKGNLTSAVLSVVRHLKEEKINSVDTLGYSYGADAAAAATQVAPEYGIQVNHGVWAEPVAVAKRGVTGLLKDFKRSEAPLESYIKAANSPPLMEARKLADKGQSRYALGLLRAGNLAIARTLASDGFQASAFRALSEHPTLKATIAWGTASEITPSAAMENILLTMRSHTVGQRVTGMALDDMHHAGGDDIDLHAAIMLQGLHYSA